MPLTSPFSWLPPSFANQVDLVNHVLRRVDLSSRAVTTIAGNAGFTGSADGVGSVARFYNPVGIAINPAGTFAIIVSGKWREYEK